MTDYEIKIDLVKLSGTAPVEDKLRYKFSIQDRGIGISKEDLPFLFTVGSSEKNRTRQKLIEAMPEWARPSGIFGIGLHSVLPQTKTLFIKTKHALSLEAREIEIISDGFREPKILIKKIEAKDVLPGTTVSFEFEADRISDPNHAEEIVPTLFRPDDVLREYDPIVDDSVSLDDEYIRREVLKSVQASPCPVYFKNEKLTALNDETEDLSFFDRENKTVVRLRNHDFGKAWRMYLGDNQNRFGVIPEYNCHFFYRGMPVLHSSTQPIPADIDIYWGTAKQVLKIDREDLSKSGTEALNQKIKGVLANAAGHFLKNSNGVSDQYLPYVSLVQHINSTSDESQGRDSKWKEVILHDVIFENKAEAALSDIAEWNHLRVVMFARNRSDDSHESRVDEVFSDDLNDGRFIKINGTFAAETLFEVLKKHYRGICFCGWGKTQTGSEISTAAYYELSKETTDENLTRRGFFDQIKAGFNFRNGVRYLIPCRDKYRDLRTTDESLRWCQTQPRVKLVPYTVLCPLEYRNSKEVTVDNLKKYIEWVFKNKKHNVSIQNIALAAWRFIEDAAEALSKPELKVRAATILDEWIDCSKIEPDPR